MSCVNHSNNTFNKPHTFVNVPSELTRRNTLKHTAGVCSLGLASGCMSSGGPIPGSLHIENNDSSRHTVTLTVQKISEDSDDSYGPEFTVTPEKSPIEERTDKFTVDGGAEKIEQDYITQPGAFFVRAELHSGESGHGWIGLYKAGRNGEEVAEEYLDVNISEEGTIWVVGQQALS